MLYKKYVIKNISNVSVSRTDNTSNYGSSSYLNISLEISGVEVSKVQYLTDNGTLIDIPFYYDTYNEAFDTLEIFSYTLNTDNSIVEISDVYDIKPYKDPNVIRSMKLRNIQKLIQQKQQTKSNI
jgi:hypothetical protein